MKRPTQELLSEYVQQAGDRYVRLILVAGPAGSGKTHALRQIHSRTGGRWVNVGLELSRRLLEVPAALRPAEAPRALAELARMDDGGLVLLDNTEILFEPSLQMHPIRTLERLARNHTVIASCTGRLDNGCLIVGASDPVRYPVESLLLVPLPTR